METKNKTVEQKVSKIAAQFKKAGVSYYYHNWTSINRALSDGGIPSLPAILYILPVSGSLDFSKADVRDAPNALFAFVDKSELDFQAHENEKVIDKLKTLAINFFVAMDASGLFYPLPANMPYKLLYDATDEIITGLTFEVSIKEKIGVCVKPSDYGCATGCN